MQHNICLLEEYKGLHNFLNLNNYNLTLLLYDNTVFVLPMSVATRKSILALHRQHVQKN